jgi:hypothetical protein
MAIAAAVAAYATWPGEDRLDYRSCEPKSGLSQLSATLYGRFFWEQALTRARDLAANTEKLDRDWAKMFEDRQRAREGDRRNQEDLYTKFPDIAPTGSQRSAQSLRDQADRIEEQETLNHLRSNDQKVITDARRCERAIIEKLRMM